jgi:outer membrane receptor protein involved in Fe transport
MYEKLVKYKLDYFSLYHIYKFSQEDFAEYEELTESYNLINLQIGLKFNNKLRCSIGLNNLLNKEYSPHTSRIRGVAGGIPNPGRSFSINLKHEF